MDALLVGVIRNVMVRLVYWQSMLARRILHTTAILRHCKVGMEWGNGIPHWQEQDLVYIILWEGATLILGTRSLPVWDWYSNTYIQYLRNMYLG